MKNLIAKFTSRKFLVAIGTILSGVALLFGLSETTAETISGAVLILGGAIGYIIAEAKLDSDSIKKAIEAVEAVADVVEAVKEDTEKCTL